MAPSEPSLPPPAPFAPPTPPTPPAPPPPSTPPTPAAPPSQPFAPPRSHRGDATATVVPVAESRPRNWVLGGVLSVLTAAVVAIGAFALFSDVPDDVFTDEAVELTTETPTRTEGFSYGSASANARSAASISFVMSIEADDGAQYVQARVDRASGRVAMEVDLSELDQGEADFVVGDSIGMIIDQQNNTVYLTANLLGGFLGEDDGWIQLDANEFNDDSSGFDQMFTNPLAVTDVLGNLEPVDLGLESVDGEMLQHFQVSVDAATLAELSGADANVFGSDIFGAADVTYDVWVSEDDQVRRITFVADDPESQERATISMDIETSPEPIEIEIPDDVVDLDELFGEMGATIED